MANILTPGQTASGMQARNLTYSPGIYHKYSDTISYQYNNYPEVLMLLFKMRGPEDFKLR